MTKAQERDNPNSCWNRAQENELMFIILERDFAAPAAIVGWAKQRCRLGMNRPDDRKIAEALKVAEEIEQGHNKIPPGADWMPRPVPVYPDGWVRTTGPKGSRGVLQLSEVCGLNSSVCDDPEHPRHFMVFLRNGEHLEVTPDVFLEIAEALGFSFENFETEDLREAKAPGLTQ